MSDQQPAEARRSRRIYVWWAVALVLLLGAGLFCWLFVVPVWQVRRAVERFRSMPIADPPMDRLINQLGGPASAVRKIRVYLRAPRWATVDRSEAVFVLGTCGHAAQSELVCLLDDDEEGVRCMAADVLDSGNREALPFLKRLLSDESQGVRVSAAGAIYRITGDHREVLPVIVEALAASDWLVRFRAAQELRMIGPPAGDAAGALEKLLKDGNGQVRQEAATALKKIRAPEEPK